MKKIIICFVITLTAVVVAALHSVHKVASVGVAAPSLQIASFSDTGISSNDGITNDTYPVITGSTGVGFDVTLYDSDGISVLGTTTADGSGEWTIYSDFLSEGIHRLTAKATDLSGNISPASGVILLIIYTEA